MIVFLPLRENIEKQKKWFAGHDVSVKDIDYKDVKSLNKFISERGKIYPRKITGLTAEQQRKVTLLIKRARHLGILPFINYGEGM